MPKKLAVLAVMLVLVLSMATSALAQQPGEVSAQDEVPACVLADACGDTSAEHQAVEEQPAMPPVPDDIDQPFEVASEGNSGVQYSGQTNCSECGRRVAQAAQDAITGGDSDMGADPTDAFDAAIDVAHSPGGTGDAAASEETRVPVEDTPSYRAAFEAAKKAGLDDEAATKTATKAAGVTVSEASRTRKGGSPSEGIAADEGKTHKEQASKDADEGKDREDEKSRKDKTREETATDYASEDDITVDADEEVAASGEDGGTGGEDVQTTLAGSRVPLLLGGVALLTVGGYAAFRFVRSRPLGVRGRRLLRS